MARDLNGSLIAGGCLGVDVEALVFGLIGIVWTIGTPIVAIFALVRASHLRRDVDALRRGVTRLAVALEAVKPGAVTAGAGAEEAPAPESAPQTASDPAHEPEPVGEPTPKSPGQTSRPPPPSPPAVAVDAPYGLERKTARARETGSSDWAGMSASIERAIAANWLVWVGAGALALGGVFMVRYAWEQGYFGPMARTVFAALAGLAMVGASEWLRRRMDPDAPGQLPRAPMAVAAAGAVSLYAAAYAAGPLYGLILPMAALVGFVLASGVAVALAAVHGALLAMLGLVGGYVAPLLMGGGEPAPAALLSYAFVVTLGALVLVRAFDWRKIVWVACAGAALWMALGVAMADGAPLGEISAAVFALALVGAATWLAWGDADMALVRDLGAEQRQSGNVFNPDVVQTVIAAHAFWVIAGVGLVGIMAAMWPAPGVLTLGALVVFGALSVGVGRQRPGFSLVPIFGGVAALAGLAVAPLSGTLDQWVSTAIGWSAFSDPDNHAYRFAVVAAAIVVVFGVGGWVAMGGMMRRAEMAIAAAFVPVGALALAFVRIGAGEQALEWGLIGGVLGMAYLVVLEGMRRGTGGLDARSGAVSAYALAAFSASMLAVGASLEEMWMTALFAAHLPALAAIDRRFGLKALRVCASIAAAIVMGRLVWPGEIIEYQVMATPFLNELTVLYAACVACFWGAARVFGGKPEGREGNLPQALEVGGLTLLAVMLSVLVRHAVTGGDLTLGYQGLVETSGYVTVFAGLSAGLMARMGRGLRPWLTVAMWAVYVISVALAVIGLGLLANPLTGEVPQPLALAGPVGWNLMTPSYLLPAALFVGHAMLARRRGRGGVAHVSGLTAMGLCLVYVTLEVRNWFRVDMSWWAGEVSAGESYMYSFVWLAFAALTLLLGVIRRRVAIRHAAMVLLAVTTAKVFVFDMASLDGVLRAASFLGLGAALIAIAVLYQRLVFAQEKPAA